MKRTFARIVSFALSITTLLAVPFAAHAQFPKIEDAVKYR
jgi:hypothetical protein